MNSESVVRKFCPGCELLKYRMSQNLKKLKGGPGVADREDLGTDLFFRKV